MSVPRLELAPGYSVSRLIKGGWQLSGGHGVVDHTGAVSDMAAYADAGITTFDCADIYTGVEDLIGQFLRSRGATDIQVHTKCVPDLLSLEHLSAADLSAAIDRSRARLGVEAIDLVQLHWWDYGAGDFVAAARMLQAIQSAGMIRHLGATNFGTPQLSGILRAGVRLVSHQVQYSLLDRRPGGAMTALCAAHGIGLLCYGSVSGGFLHERWLGKREPPEPLENRSLTKYKLIIDEFGGWERFQALLELLSAVGRGHGVGIGPIAIRWVLDQPAVAAVIVGARNTQHLGGTLDALRLTLTGNDQALLRSFLAESPGPQGDVYELERDRDGPHGRIMRYNLSSKS